jgi:hypothetical protein
MVDWVRATPLNHLIETVDQLTARAETEQLGYLDFLDQVLEEELGLRESRRFRNADCGFLNVCPAVAQRRGALGISGRAVATRALTATDLQAYDRCPTAFAVQRRDHLPDGYPEHADIDGLARIRRVVGLIGES